MAKNNMDILLGNILGSAAISPDNKTNIDNVLINVLGFCLIKSMTASASTGFPMRFCVIW